MRQSKTVLLYNSATVKGTRHIRAVAQNYI
jgi:hypothetical protein